MENLNNIFTIIITISTSFSIGSIIVALINISYNRKTTITEIDKKKFYFYKSIFFSAVKNSLHEEIELDISQQFYKNLHQQIKNDENKSLLLSKQVIYLLKKINDEKKYEITSKLNKQIEKDFNNIKYKFNYQTANTKDKIIYAGFVLLLLLSLMFFFSSIIILVAFISTGNFLSYLNENTKIMILLISSISTILTSIYLIDNSYVIKK